MKRRSPLATLVGAVPGALPPVIGWTASHGSLSSGGAALFAIVFLWQIPHFMAIAWLYRDDYRHGRLSDAAGDRARRPQNGTAGGGVRGGVAAGQPDADADRAERHGVFRHGGGARRRCCSASSVRFARSRNDRFARVLFLASIIYLPLIWLAMILDKS